MASHAGFIAAAYAVTGLVLAGMLLAIVLDHRGLNRTVGHLTERLRRENGGEVPVRTPGGSDHEP